VIRQLDADHSLQFLHSAEGFGCDLHKKVQVSPVAPCENTPGDIRDQAARCWSLTPVAP